MATRKQKTAVDKMVENGGNVSKAMRDAGYTEATAKTPKKLTESIGFQELCNECGLTDEFLTKALVEDIKIKKQNRKPELELGFKIKGKLSDKLDITSQGEKITLTNEQLKEIARRIPDGDSSSEKKSN